jgi:lipopolysaccharide export system protein LptA
VRIGRAVVVGFACVGAATSAAAQTPQECLLDYESPTGNTRTTALQLPSGRYNIFQGGGVIYRCRDQDNTIAADSSEYYGDQSVLYLIGNVHYRETKAKVDSDRMTYYQLEDRLRAEGNVNVVLQSGTTMRGPVADYYRATASRPLAKAVATGHPVMRLVERTSTGQPAQPVNVVANQIVSEGENLVYASGAVEITRPDVIAKGDSAFLDSRREFARLLRSPSVVSKGERPFTLRGGIIDLYSTNRVLRKVIATPDGHALSEDLELVADSLDLRLKDDKLQEVIAWGKKRARAISPEREIVADSIDVIMPGQRIREVRAVRNAYANSVPDTLHVISTERDWMRGDVIVAEFDSVATNDTTTKPQPRRIVATGNATSYHQMAADTRIRTLPNINYVKGKAITVLFANREVTRVEVFEQASGVYIEPLPAGAPVTPAAPVTSPPAGRASPAAGTLPPERTRRIQ